MQINLSFLNVTTIYKSLSMFSGFTSSLTGLSKTSIKVDKINMPRGRGQGKRSAEEQREANRIRKRLQRSDTNFLLIGWIIRFKKVA